MCVCGAFCAVATATAVVAVVAALLGADVGMAPRWWHMSHHPEWYHGPQSCGDCEGAGGCVVGEGVGEGVGVGSRLFFEGWYYKFAKEGGDASQSFVIVPGVFFGGPNEELSHAFIFTIFNGSSHYYRFDQSSFEFTEDELGWGVKVGSSSFTHSHITLDLSPKATDDASLDIKGTLNLGKLSPWHVTHFEPGAMGLLGYLPFLECFHGIMSMDHDVSGTLTFDSPSSGPTDIDYSGARGYIEKDWGTQFPTSWIWMQCNNFKDNTGVSFMLSAARVPIFGYSLPGFLSSFVDECGNSHHFATHHLRSFLHIHDLSLSSATFDVGDSSVSIHAELRKSQGVMLYGPKGGRMQKYVWEDLAANLTLTVSSPCNHNSKATLSCSGKAAAEFEGDMDWLVKKF